MYTTYILLISVSFFVCFRVRSARLVKVTKLRFGRAFETPLVGCFASQMRIKRKREPKIKICIDDTETDWETKELYKFSNRRDQRDRPSEVIRINGITRYEPLEPITIRPKHH